MKEFSRRDFIKLAGVGALSMLVGGVENLVLPEKPIRFGQGVLFVMPSVIGNSFPSDEIKRFEDTIGHRIHGISLFTDMDMKKPFNPLIEKVLESGRAVMINLQPRFTFEEKKEQYFNSKEFLNGSYDQEIQTISNTLMKFKIPIYVRFAFEMNGSWFSWGNKPGEFSAIYKYVVNKFRENGASNIKWIFSPNHFPQPETIDQYYPGNECVDLVGADFYEKGIWSFLPPEFSFDQINYQLKKLAPEKPLIVGEIGGSGKNRDEWLSEAIYKNLRQGATIINYFQINKEMKWKLENKKEIPKIRGLMGSGIFLEDGADLETINKAILTVN